MFGRTTEVLKRVKLRDAHLIGAEVGAYAGQMSEQLLANLLNLKLYMIDRWAAVPEDHRYRQSGSIIAQHSARQWEGIEFQARCVALRYPKRTIVLKGESTDCAEQVEAESLDFVFIDADHTYEGVREDLGAWFGRVKPGGWIMGHDYDHPETHIRHKKGMPRRWGVKQAVDEFFAHLPVKIGEDRTWAVLKP